MSQPYGTDFGIRDPFGNQIRINQFNDASAQDIEQAYDGATTA